MSSARESALVEEALLFGCRGSAQDWVAVWKSPETTDDVAVALGVGEARLPQPFASATERADRRGPPSGRTGYEEGQRSGSTAGRARSDRGVGESRARGVGCVHARRVPERVAGVLIENKDRASAGSAFHPVASSPRAGFRERQESFAKAGQLRVLREPAVGPASRQKSTTAMASAGAEEGTLRSLKAGAAMTLGMCWAGIISGRAHAHRRHGAAAAAPLLVSIQGLWTVTCEISPIVVVGDARRGDLVAAGRSQLDSDESSDMISASC